MAPISINFLAVIVSAVAYMVIGAVWYSPVVFGKMWIKFAGITQKDIDIQKKTMPKIYGFAFVGALITSYILAIILKLVDATTLIGALQIGFLVWLGFMATTTLSTVLFEGKKQELYLLNNGYNLVALLTAAAILTVWI
ncbi:hypothetical protein A3A60_02345 [Candidatus Curtissbacteria bacterium RIFCSPLOWO2_01_FULL_42_26]|uniref:DUF1761 domain-containing protein n=1 Tax=Candidatus Curtissbacteria bacterium RIFCSPLOWO2_01_FULL_42_26 TaxID=1797729 RepID=A0A1F5I351_9BACT|nr:MAG: hypothetical protein A3A60_02345 [Candidatus Curtissbacteria bacterium RIFCSPLOWO2_01_FULL_42_26]